jgi:hypothetical protein
VQCGQVGALPLRLVFFKQKLERQRVRNTLFGGVQWLC